jgi:putative ABC transport system ATP-binding protein
VIALADAYQSYRTKLGNTPVLRGIDLEVNPGEFVLILGPRGCGKSTLLNVLSCLKRLDSGSYFLLGNDTTRLEERALADLRGSRVGIVFEKPTLLANATVYRNVALPLLYAGVPAALRAARVMSALKAVQMEGFASRPCHAISVDQKQRVAIARALVNDPALILADEPLGPIDPKAADDILRLLLNQRSSGRALVVLSCDFAWAEFADRIYLCENGILTTHPLELERERKWEQEREQKQAQESEEDIYRPLIEAEEESRTIFDDTTDEALEIEATDLPVDLALEEALQGNFVKEDWWRR